jgi:hypothetical protein
MNNQYSALLSGFFGAVVGAGASVAVVWIQSREWLRQQRWGNREKHYMELLSNLTRLKLSLQGRSEYYDEPGSEHDERRSESEEFQTLTREGGDALRAIRQQIGMASVYLSQSAINALERMLTGLWHTAQDSVCTAEYVTSALSLVDAAYSAVRDEARRELRAGQGT